MKARTGIPQIYARLFAANGKQRWWPGDGAFEIMVGAVLTQNTAWINVESAIPDVLVLVGKLRRTVLNGQQVFPIRNKRCT